MYLSRVKPGSGSLLRSQSSWDDLTLPLALLNELQQLSTTLSKVRVGSRARLYGPNPWSAAQFLFCGPSGAGKISAAQSIGGDLGLATWKIPAAALVGRYIGETEKNLNLVFDRARRNGWVLFFDEADALFGKRTGVISGGSRYANQEISYLLRRAEHYRGIVIISTSSKPNLGSHLVRRIQRVVEFP